MSDTSAPASPDTVEPDEVIADDSYEDLSSTPGDIEDDEPEDGKEQAE